MIYATAAACCQVNCTYTVNGRGFFHVLSIVMAFTARQGRIFKPDDVGLIDHSRDYDFSSFNFHFTVPNNVNEREYIIPLGQKCVRKASIDIDSRRCEHETGI